MNIRVKFTKTGVLRFMGHLDILRYFQKANRRAEIDVKYSAGFNPHQIMSFSAPLGLGLTSEGEYMDMEVNSTASSAEMVKKLNDTMAEGMKILSWRKLPEQSKSAMAIVVASDYEVYFKEGYEPENRELWVAQMENFIAQSSIFVEKQTKKKIQEMDIRPMIYHLETFVEDLSVKENRVNVSQGKQLIVRMQLATGSVDNLKPELVMEAFSKFIGQEYNPFAVQIHRVELYAKDEETDKLISLEDMGEDIGETNSCKER